MFYDNWNGIWIRVVLGDETIWMTQKVMWELFGVDVSTINEHIKNIYNSWELDEKLTIGKFPIVQKEWERDVRRIVAFYNLDVILSVWYRVTSKEATKFRIWANEVLKQYVIKWYVLDKDRLKQGNQVFWKDYFQELLEDIREIRSSEKMFYKKITEIFKLSWDYDSSSDIAREFFATIQNKLHYASHEQTWAETIKERANRNKPYMWLTSRKNQGKWWKIVKSDVSVAKNYLTSEELRELNRITSMLLDFAESMAERWKIMKMADWIVKIDNFLRLNEYPILDNPWLVSSAEAKRLAYDEYETFRVQQDKDYISDFDNFVQKAKNLNHIESSIELSSFNAKLKTWLDYNPREEDY